MTKTPYELFENAKLNLETLCMIYPYVKSDPFFQLAMEQLANGIKALHEQDMEVQYEEED